MPVPPKLDPVALPEKGRYVEGPLLYTPHSVEGLTEKCWDPLAGPLGKLPGYPPITLDRTLLFACFQSGRTNQLPKAGSHIKERGNL